MRKLLFLILIFSGFTLSAQIYHTRIFSPDIKTLQIGLVGEKLGLPIMEMNSSDIMQVSFDEMSHEAHSYSYKLIHCNADWTQSSLNTSEYLNGFTTENITDFAQSINTTFLYTHYTFQIPNNDMTFKVSGNFVVVIFEDNKVDNPIAQACFSVVEPHVSIAATVRGNTDTELSGSLQQLDFVVDLKGYPVRDVTSEIKVVVCQNNRTDNEVTDIQPTYYSGSDLKYVNNKALIFDGGYEYHRFDFSSIYAAGEGIEDVKFNAPHYDIILKNDKIRTSKIYSSEMDVNGKFIINLQNAKVDDNVEADYMYVHFNLPTKQVFFDGQLYLGGEFNYNLMNDAVRMKYDIKTESYVNTVLLKQGGYNYQYWFMPKGETKAGTGRVDGNYWQTGNEYTIYIYDRPWGEQYDKLIGVKVIESGTM